jgi:hypothetical protein
MDPCNDIQEKIAGGAPLHAAEQRHTADCARCAAVASAYSLLDVTLGAFVPVVPPGFADRVMALVAEAEDAGPAPARWFERRWIQIAFAHAAAVCAVLNVARFLVRIFVSDVALGGTP